MLETIKGGVTIYPASADFDKQLAISPQDSTKSYSWHAQACDMASMNQTARKEWTLMSLNGKQVITVKPPTIKFENGKVAIFGGINRLTGSYALLGDTVMMGSLVSTMTSEDSAPDGTGKRIRQGVGLCRYLSGFRRRTDAVQQGNRGHNIPLRAVRPNSSCPDQTAYNVPA